MSAVPTRIRTRARRRDAEQALEAAGVHPLLARLLAARGTRKGDLSRFVEDAVRQQILHLTKALREAQQK